MTDTWAGEYRDVGNLAVDIVVLGQEEDDPLYRQPIAKGLRSRPALTLREVFRQHRTANMLADVGSNDRRLQQRRSSARFKSRRETAAEEFGRK